MILAAWFLFLGNFSVRMWFRFAGCTKYRLISASYFIVCACVGSRRVFTVCALLKRGMEFWRLACCASWLFTMRLNESFMNSVKVFYERNFFKELLAVKVENFYWKGAIFFENQKIPFRREFSIDLWHSCESPALSSVYVNARLCNLYPFLRFEITNKY